MATSEQIDKWLADAQGPYTLEQLSEAFDQVANKENWKYPVDATVPADADTDLIDRAVIWFTGSVPAFIDETGEAGEPVLRVVAAGYYNSVGS